MLNRCAVVLRSRQAHLDWVKHVSEETELTMEDLNSDPAVFLLEEFENEDEQEALLEHYFPTLFELMLDEWSDDESDWPLVRDLSTFMEWFDISFHGMVHDLVDEPLWDDADDDGLSVDED